jgi:hypothetical protein
MFAAYGLLTIHPHFSDDAVGAVFVPQGDNPILSDTSYSGPKLEGLSRQLIRLLV